jgi:glycosyltransferase involved in cell wall biosynthesis
MQVINHSELPCNWNWLEKKFNDHQLRWEHASTQAWPGMRILPASTTLKRLRAAWLALSYTTKETSLLVSHGPRPALYASTLAFGRLKKTPHLAFSFNFTELPSPRRQAIMARAFQSIDRFTVFSSMEKKLYSRVFDLDPKRIDVLHWAVEPFKKSQLLKPVQDPHYICAVGSQGRDYRVLMGVMSQLPQCRLHLVAYPENLVNLKIPDNVTIHQNVPFEFAAALVAHADAMVLPLIGSEVPCGHVTAVMAMHLGVPVIATDSIGLHDYLRQDDTAMLFPTGEENALKQCLESFLDNPAHLLSCADRAFKFAQDYCVEERTIEYFQKYIEHTFGFTPLIHTEG